MDKYIITDVSSSNKEIILVKLIPRTSSDKIFQEYVARVYSSCKNAAELGVRCGYDCQRTFTRHFKKSFGETPYKWMLDRKMDEIQCLILNSDITLKEITKLYNFKNITHLVNAYTSRFGMAPLKSRALATG